MKMKFYINENYSKKNLDQYFKDASRDNSEKIIINNERREVFAPSIVERIKDYLIPGNSIVVTKNSKDIHTIFSDLKITNTDNETEKVLELLIHQNYKLIGHYNSNGSKKPINLIFERHGSNYKIRDHGQVSNSLLKQYINSDS